MDDHSYHLLRQYQIVKLLLVAETYRLQNILSTDKLNNLILFRLVSIKKRDLTDPESISEVRWMNIDELIAIMKTQGEDDESKILEDVKRFYLK